jgi:hypothetical protein
MTARPDDLDPELIWLEEGPESGQQFPDDPPPRLFVPRCHVCSAPLHLYDDGDSYECYCPYCTSFGLATDGLQ